MRAWKSLAAAGVGFLFLASSTCHAGTIHACRTKVGGTVRIVGAAATCLATEVKLSWPDASRTAALKARVAGLTALVGDLTAQATVLSALLQHFSRNGDDVSITGANLWIKSGAGSTEAPENGLGNLIVGYNEARFGGDLRTGSHNVVVGVDHGYPSYGGLVVGNRNSIRGHYASVSGGAFNNAAAHYSSASGGGSGFLRASSASVSGGLYGNAEGSTAWIGGGELNGAYGLSSAVAGGTMNAALGAWTSVSGGDSRVAADNQSDWVAGKYWSDN